MILGVIIACEIGFWVFITLGLIARYLLGWRRTGLVLLAMAPVVDLILLIATAVHLRSGATAGIEHAIAAVYIGFSVTYGHRMIAWADRHFAHRFAGGPKPVRLTGAAYTRLCWGDVRRTGLAALITSALTFGLVQFVGPNAKTDALEGNYRWMAFIFALDLGWAIWTTFNPRPDDQSSTANSSSAEMSKT